MELKAIFFDLDGVLILSENLHYHAWKKVLDHLKIDNRDFIFKEVLGFSDQQVAEFLAQKYHLEKQQNLNRLVAAKKKYFASYIQKGFASPLGRDEFLNFLKKQAKLILAVVSSCLRKEIKSILEEEKIAQYFDFYIGSDEVAESKPAADPYLKALETAKTKPEESLIIEDSPTGIEAAINAKIPIIAMATTFSSFSNHSGIPFFKNFKEVKKHLLQTRLKP